jgi:hypothetical protein
MQSHVDRADTVWVENAMIAIFSLPASDSTLSRVLRANEVWQQGQLNDLVELRNVEVPIESSRPYLGPRMQSSHGINIGTFVAELERVADSERAPSINELHVAETLVKLGGDALLRTGVNSALMVKRVSDLLGRAESSIEDRQKVWCFCDTTFFQESRAPFDQIDWPAALALGRPVVLAIAPVVVRELDDQKGDPRSHRSRQRDRARKVLGRLDWIIDHRVGARPVVVRVGVEVLLVDREPAVMPEGLNRAVADDVIVAAALEFQWKHPDLDVAILSDDRGPRIKAGQFDMRRISLPDAERRRDPAPETPVDTSKRS